MTNKYIDESYTRHEGGFLDYAKGGIKADRAKTWLQEDTVNAWRHKRIYQIIDPFLLSRPSGAWLTVGDGRYGNDAHYIQEKGLKVVATDISDHLLREALEAGYIRAFKKENAEALSFSEGEFDFVFCKEAYHHFPRPIIALYEMLRVCNKAVILIEPCDAFITSSFLKALFIKCKELLKKILNIKIYRHSFEEIGNYVYAISKREIEKVALGLNLDTVAFHGINDCYIDGVEFEKLTDQSKLFNKIKWKIMLHDFLHKIKLTEKNLLVAVIFKQKPDEELKRRLLLAGYEVRQLPKNPYI